MPCPSLIEVLSAISFSQIVIECPVYRFAAGEPEARTSVDLGQREECLVWPGVAGAAQRQIRRHSPNGYGGATARYQDRDNEWGSGAFPYKTIINQNEAKASEGSSRFGSSAEVETRLVSALPQEADITQSRAVPARTDTPQCCCGDCLRQEQNSDCATAGDPNGYLRTAQTALKRRGLGRVLINRQPNANLDAPPNFRYWG